MSMRRLLEIGSTLVLLMTVALCRVYWLVTNTAYAASARGQANYLAELPRQRGSFYDRNGRLLTDQVQVWYGLCIPGDSSYASLFPYVPYSQQGILYDRRNAASPFLVEVDRDLTGQGVLCCQRAKRYLPQPVAVHLLGYLDGEGHGVSGLERAYEDVLSSAGNRQTVECMTTAQGRLMDGTEPIYNQLEQGNGLGVQLTLDAEIQRLCEGIAGGMMTRGCILVQDAQNAEVLATVSVPEYDPNNIGKSIAADDTSLINRSLSAFSSGSVFKVVLAVAAYQKGLDWYSWECEGSVDVGGQVYRCALGRAHGEVNLRAALEQSCNCYFIELGKLLGGETILETAKSLGFGVPCAVAPGLKSAAGVLPDTELLENAGQLAMFSFGQGALTVTPIQISQMMDALVNDGVYRPARFVRGIVKAETLESVQPMEIGETQRVCNADVAAVLRDMLQSVVEDGIGAEASPLHGSAGGKTGTAQTGQFNKDGQELLNYWFAGFYPAEEPRYVITVLQDGIRSPEHSSAAVFAAIADGLAIYDPLPQEDEMDAAEIFP